MSNGETQIIGIEPLAKSQERVYFADGSKVRRCYGPHNPHYYEDESHKLLPIDISNIIEKGTRVGKSHLRSKNVVSVGFRDDANPEKYLGLRPDINQKTGEEQLEFSIVSIKFEGEEVPIDLSKNQVVNPVVTDLGNIQLVSTRQRTRQMVKVDSSMSRFKITYRIHLKGLKIGRREDLDEFWIYNLKDEFRFRIVKPSIIGTVEYEPVMENEDVQTSGLVSHSLIREQGGTYFYIKESTQKFKESLLIAPYFIDGDIYYSTTADGYVYKQAATWVACRDATTGFSANNNASCYYVTAGHTTDTLLYLCDRGFLYFDTSGATNPSAVDFKYYRDTFWTAATTYILCMKGTQADSLTTADYNNFTGSSYGNVQLSSFWNSLSFNPTGVSDINTSGTTKVCQREKGHDFDNIAPTGHIRYGAMFRSYDYTGTTYDPYLEITEGIDMKINISDVWKDVSEVKINIGDSWKTVTEMKINIGDVWKDIF